MSTKTNKGSFLAKALPSIFGFLNEKDVDQAKLAEFEQEAKAALEAGGGEGLDNPEDLEEPDTEASEDDELTKLKAQVDSLTKANASLKSENSKFKTSHQKAAAAGRVTPKEDISARNQEEEPVYAANSPMGFALAQLKARNPKA